VLAVELAGVLAAGEPTRDLLRLLVLDRNIFIEARLVLWLFVVHGLRLLVRFPGFGILKA